MELTLGSAYQKHTFNALTKTLNDALKQGHIGLVDYRSIHAALSRLVSKELPADHRVCADLQIIRQGLNRVKPSYFSRSGGMGLIGGAVKGAFVLCLAVALSPTLPLWLYCTIPSVVAMTDYLFFNHHAVANTIRGYLTEFENGYLRTQLATRLINQERFCDEALEALNHSPLKGDLMIPFLNLRNHLLSLYRIRQLTVSGAIDLHQSMNELMHALNEQNVDQVYRKLAEVERLIDISSPPTYQATKSFFMVGAIIGVAVIALSIISAGTFTGFCATVYAVTLLAAQCAVVGYLFDALSNLCKQSDLSNKFSPFKSSVSRLFKPMREEETTTKGAGGLDKSVKQGDLSEIDEFLADSVYLNLATT